ncbi:unnamed protein product [Oppiella nova]|uniref:RING-type domain-containing protein n=1 Tax=Oppiella nova TaxID=334625 RepID=A0A7R9QIK0_9ACAR|nr:unnamed protein product [Oppiella nova]CAG2166570.1 unnamed protein product [Oppiella nova]
MPGLDKSRFVDISTDDLNEFICGICMDVFENPVFSPCCRQTYCKDCITGWLKNQKTCPNDRKPLTVNLLSSPPRVLINLMNKLRIRCDFHDTGCQEVLKLCELSDHKDSCLRNPNRKCADCALPVGVGHNCIANMKLNIESINDEIRRLQRENNHLKTEADRLKRNQNNTNVSREDKTLRIVNSRMNEGMKEFAINCADCALPVGVGHNCIANMKLNIVSINDEIRRLQRENSHLKTEADRLKRNQNNTNVSREDKTLRIVNSRMNEGMKEFAINVSREDKTLRIVNSRMNEGMKEFAINVANEAHDRYRNEPEGRLSTFVRNEFEKKYKSLWNCLVSSSINWGTSIHHFENHYIYFKIGLFHFMIWESSK